MLGDAAKTYKIVDSEDGKTIGFYSSYEAAESAAFRIRREHPSLSHSLLVVTMDASGMPVKGQGPRPAEQGVSVNRLMKAAVAHVRHARQARHVRRVAS